MQKKLLILPLLLLLFLAACSGQAEPATEPSESMEQQPQQEGAVEELPEARDESLQQVSARPQLVEFYADW